MTPNPKAVKEIREPLVTQKLQKEVLERCYRYNFNLNVQWLVGLPGETEATLAKDYWLISNDYKKTFKEFNFASQPLIVYPGSALWKQAVVKRLASENQTDWSNFQSENISNKTPILNTLQVQGKFKNIISKFKDLDKINQQKGLMLRIHNKDIMLKASLSKLLEYFVKLPSIKSVLQITDENIFNISSIFTQDNYEFETLDMWKFNQKEKPKPNKKYDCIIIYYSLDMLKNPERILKYCNQSLEKGGKLLSLFHNTLNGYDLTSLTFNKDSKLNESFYKFERLNFFTVKTFEKLLEKNGFKISMYNPIYLDHELSETKLLKNLIGTVRSLDRSKNFDDFRPTAFMTQASKM